MLHKCIKCSQNRGETTIVNSAKTLHFVKIGGMVKALIWSVTLHEAETWTMTKEHVKQIKASEMWIWRRLERISWTKHRTNEEVLKKVEEKRSLMDIIRTRLGMLIENWKSGFRFENRNPVFDFENRFLNLFFKIIFPIENCIMLKRNS